MTSLALDFGHVFSIGNEIPPGEQASNPIKRAVGYRYRQPCHCCAMGRSCLADWYCRSIDIFSFSAGFVTALNSLKASHQGESFVVTLR